VNSSASRRDALSSAEGGFRALSGSSPFVFEVQTSIEIDAPPDVVWSVLVDVDSWSSWNTVTHHEAGSLNLGDRPRLRLDPPEGRAYAFRPTVTVREECRRLEWIGRTGVPGVFDGRHRYELQPSHSPHRTRFIDAERFSGLLAPIARRTFVDPEAIRRGFETFDTELARRAESLAAT
jgi:hypothetical protein